MRLAVLFSAAMLTFPLQLALTGWTAGWLLARYGLTPAWAMWFFIGLESCASSYVVFLIYLGVLIVGKFVKYYLEERTTHDAVQLKINGVKIFQLKGARSQSDGDAEKPSECDLDIQIVYKAADKEWKKILFTVYAAPILETAKYQMLIIITLRLIGFDIAAQIAVSAFVFAYVHFKNNSVQSGFTSIPAGLYLGFTYAHWAQTSPWEAFWVTAAAHALHNLLAMLISFIRSKMFAKRTDE